jgi:hypothetical protein
VRSVSEFNSTKIYFKTAVSALHLGDKKRAPAPANVLLYWTECVAEVCKTAENKSEQFFRLLGYFAVRGNPETSVSNHLAPLNNPQDGRIQFNRGGRLWPRKSREFEFWGIISVVTAPYSRDTGGKTAEMWRWPLTPKLVPRLRISGAKPPLKLRDFTSCTETTL